MLSPASDEGRRRYSGNHQHFYRWHIELDQLRELSVFEEPCQAANVGEL